MNIPTALTAAETRFLRTLAADRRVVECGALLGYSTIVMAKAGAYVTSIDKHEGYGPPTLRPFLGNVLHHGVAGRVEPRVADVRLLDAVAGDLAVIDLTGERHLTEDVIRKCQAPLILIHDAGRQRCEGVGEAIEAQNLQIIEGVGTFVLCSKGVRYDHRRTTESSSQGRAHRLGA